MNLSPSQQLAYSRDSPLDPRTWDLSERMASQSGLSGKNTPDGGPASGTPPTMPHQVTALGAFQERDSLSLTLKNLNSGKGTPKFWSIRHLRHSCSPPSRYVAQKFSASDELDTFFSFGSASCLLELNDLQMRKLSA